MMCYRCTACIEITGVRFWEDVDDVMRNVVSVEVSWRLKFISL